MKEYTFKVLRKGEVLCGFTAEKMIIKTESGEYHFHDIVDFNIEKPRFSKQFSTATIFTENDISSNLFVIKTAEREYRVYKVENIENDMPVLNDKFCVVVKKGVGKLEIRDTESELTITVPAEEII